MKKILLSIIFSFYFILVFSQVRFEKTEKFTTTANFSAVKVADINSDGLTDIIAATSSAFGSSEDDAKIFIYLQDSTFKLNKKIILNYSPQYPGLRSLDIGDVNNDGLKDIIIGFSDSIGIAYQIKLNEFSTFYNQYCFRNVSKVFCKDINNDSLNDIVVSNYYYESYLKIFLQSQSGLKPKTLPRNKKQYAYPYVDLEDFNGDKLIDLAYHQMQNYPDTSVYIKYFDSTSGYANDNIGLTYFTYEDEKWLNDLKAGDYNNDGKADILGLNISADSIHLWKNSGTGFSREKKIKTHQFSNKIGLIDTDCDNVQEILVVGDISVSIHNPNDDFKNFKTFYVPDQFSSPANSHNQFDIGDVNNDSKQDIILAFLDGIVVMSNTSIPISFSSIDTIRRVDSTSVNYSPITFKDARLTILDTLGNLIIRRVDSFNIIKHTTSFTFLTDSIFVRSGFVCNNFYSDTLFSEKVQNSSLVFTYDSTLFYSSTDTLTVNSNSFWLYPNPVINNLCILGQSNAEPILLEIISLNGKIIYRETFRTNGFRHCFNIPNLNSGIYLIRINNSSSTINKIIKY